MNKILLMAITIVTLFGCGNKAQEGKESIDIKLSALHSDKDPTCGMTLMEGSIADTMTIDGKLYGFCGTSCKPADGENEDGDTAPKACDGKKCGKNCTCKSGAKCNGKCKGKNCTCKGGEKHGKAHDHKHDEGHHHDEEGHNHGNHEHEAHEHKH